MKALQLWLILILIQACGPVPYDSVTFQPDAVTEVITAAAEVEYDTPEIPYYGANESIPHCDTDLEGDVIYIAKSGAYYNCLIIRSIHDTTGPGGINALDNGEKSDGAWVRIPHPEE